MPPMYGATHVTGGHAYGLVGNGGGPQYGHRHVATMRPSGLNNNGRGGAGAGGDPDDTGAGSGGTGASKPNKIKSSLSSNTSTVSGSLIVSTSVTGSPVEIPNGTTSRPHVTNSGNFV